MVLSLAACDKTDPDQVDKTPIQTEDSQAVSDDDKGDGNDTSENRGN